MESLIESKNINGFIEIYKNKLIKLYEDETFEKRCPGITTMKYMKKLYNGLDYKIFNYDVKAGGGGCGMRGMCFGLLFNGINNRNKLINYAIESGLLTHPNAIAYLGAVGCALFISFAIEKINIEEWPRELIKILKGGKIENHIKKGKGEIFLIEHNKDKKIFIEKWEKYLKIRDKLKKIKLVYKKSFLYNYYFSNNKNFIYPGGSGLDSVLIGYDNLYNCGNNFEFFFINNCLHVGDGDTTGIIGCALYGILYENMNVPKNFLDSNFEFKDILIKLGEKIYEKIGK